MSEQYQGKRRNDTTIRVEEEESAFSFSSGKRKAITENIWSTELDGGEKIKIEPHASGKKKMLAVIISVVAIIAVILGIIFVTKMQKAESVPQVATVSISSIFPKTETNSVTQTIELKGNTFVSAETTLTASEVEVSPPLEPCDTVNATDFCEAGAVLIGDQPYAVYYARNMAKNENFNNIKNFQEISLKDNALIASGVMNFLNKDSQFLMFTNGKNGAGWFVEVPITWDHKTIVNFSGTFGYIFK